MQPRRDLLPLLLTVFHVTNSGESETAGLGYPPRSWGLRMKEKSEERDEETEVVEESSVRREVEEPEDGVEAEDEEDVEERGASRRLIAAGR